MRIGKVSESVLKRSVLRLIKNSRVEVMKGAEVGSDCAFLSWNNGLSQTEDGLKGLTALSTQTITLPVKNAAYLAVMAAANNLAAEGVGPAAVTLGVILPEDAQEELLKEIMKQAQRCCDDLQMQIIGGHTEVSPAVKTPVITATAAGGAFETGLLGMEAVCNTAQKQVKNGCRDAAGMDIVASKWVGLEGTTILAAEKEEELGRRYPMQMINQAKAYEKYLSVASEAAIALKSGVYAMHDMRNGGVFGALWELSRKIGVGLTVNLKDIPIKQETIEICEFFDLNPYELLSGGSLLMVTKDGEELTKRLGDMGISAAVIGRTDKGNDKTVINQDEVRYLTMPSPDEIFKVSFYAQENSAG